MLKRFAAKYLKVLCSVQLILFSENVCSAAGLGITIDRDRLVTACQSHSNRSDDCLSPVFIHYSINAESVDLTTDIPKSVSSAIPVQLSSSLSFVLSSKMAHECLSDELWDELVTITDQSSEKTGNQTIAVPIPERFGNCFTLSAKPGEYPTIVLLLRSGVAHGFVECDKDIKGIPVCDLFFSKISEDEQKAAKTPEKRIVERISMSAFRWNEIEDLLNHFNLRLRPANTVMEQNAVDAFNWLETLFQDGVDFSEVK